MNIQRRYIPPTDTMTEAYDILSSFIDVDAFFEGLFDTSDIGHATVGAEGADGTGAGGEGYEVAEVDANYILTPPEAPGPEAFNNPRGYLEYLRFYVEERINIFEMESEKPYYVYVSADGQSSELLTPQVEDNPAVSWLDEYKTLREDIDAELAQPGGPRASELGELYNRVESARRALA